MHMCLVLAIYAHMHCFKCAMEEVDEFCSRAFVRPCCRTWGVVALQDGVVLASLLDLADFFHVVREYVRLSFDFRPFYRRPPSPSTHFNPLTGERDHPLVRGQANHFDYRRRRTFVIAKQSPNRQFPDSSLRQLPSRCARCRSSWREKDLCVTQHRQAL